MNYQDCDEEDDDPNQESRPGGDRDVHVRLHGVFDVGGLCGAVL